jgi:hypothetical protein
VGAEATAHLVVEQLECMPEIFCYGEMNPAKSVIKGDWHMNFKMSARCYREPRFEGDPEPEEKWRGQRAFPAPVSEIMMQVRHEADHLIISSHHRIVSSSPHHRIISSSHHLITSSSSHHLLISSSPHLLISL